MTRARLALTLSLAVTLLSSGPVVADEPARPMRPAARVHLDEGVKLYNIQRYAEAIEEFRAGYQLDERPEFLFAIAQAQRLAGDCASAITAYEAFLRSSPAEAQATSAQSQLERCREEVAKQRAAAAAAAAVAAAAAEAARRTLPPPRPPFYTDAPGDALLVAGLGAVAAGAITWTVGYRSAAAVGEAMRYDVFDARHAAAQSAPVEQAAGIATAGVGAALILGAIVRYAVRPAPTATNERHAARPSLRLVDGPGAGLALAGTF